MLVLSRKQGERFYIGDDICITVVDVNQGKVRIGVEAPRSIPVNREEIYLEIQRQKRAEGRREGGDANAKS